MVNAPSERPLVAEDDPNVIVEAALVESNCDHLDLLVQDILYVLEPHLEYGLLRHDDQCFRDWAWDNLEHADLVTLEYAFEYTDVSLLETYLNYVQDPTEIFLRFLSDSPEERNYRLLQAFSDRTGIYLPFNISYQVRVNNGSYNNIRLLLLEGPELVNLILANPRISKGELGLALNYMNRRLHKTAADRQVIRLLRERL